MGKRTFRNCRFYRLKKYVSEHNTGMKVSNLYIAQVKRKCGIEAEQLCNELGLDEEEK